MYVHTLYAAGRTIPRKKKYIHTNDHMACYTLCAACVHVVNGAWNTTNVAACMKS